MTRSVEFARQNMLNTEQANKFTAGPVRSRCCFMRLYGRRTTMPSGAGERRERYAVAAVLCSSRPATSRIR
jgi:hypothetical protein